MPRFAPCVGWLECGYVCEHFVFNEMGGWQSQTCNLNESYSLAKGVRVPVRRSARGWSLIKSIWNTGRLQLNWVQEVSLGNTKWATKTKVDGRAQDTPINCILLVSGGEMGQKIKTQTIPLLKVKIFKEQWCFFFLLKETERAWISTGTCFMWLDLFFPHFSTSLSVYTDIWHQYRLAGPSSTVLCWTAAMLKWPNSTHSLAAIKAPRSSLSKKKKIKKKICGWYVTGTETAGHREKKGEVEGGGANRQMWRTRS